MKCKFCGRETEHEEEDICKKCLAEKLGREIERHPIRRG
jgi:NMD protein affecting ribosome stability and mRNA decay